LIRTPDGKRIFVVGMLDAKIKHTPKGRNFAESEPTQEFTLHSWYLVTPFLEERTTPKEDYYTIKRKQLKRSDFESFRSEIKLDISSFQRGREQHK